MAEQSDDDLLPEDDSIFHNISMRSDNLSSDALLEESFSEFIAHTATSTPSSKGTRRSARLASPSKSPMAGPSTQSPRRSARLSSPSKSLKDGPSPSPESPRRSARLASPSRSPMAGPSSQSPHRPASVASSSPSNSSATIENFIRPSPLASQTSQQSQSQRGKGRAGSSRSTSKSAAKSSRIKCPKCPSTLQNKKTLDSHLRGHFMTGVTSKAPSLQELTQEMVNLIKSALKDMLQEVVIGELSQLVHNYCSTLEESFNDPTLHDDELVTLLSERFSEMLLGRKALFPSSIRTSLCVGTNNLLCSPEFRQTIKGYFQLLKESHGDVMNVFIGDFMRTLSNKVLVYCIKKMKGDLNNNIIPYRSKRGSDDFTSVEFKQTVYHIAGSIVNGFLWKGRQYSESSRVWAKYCLVIKSNLLSRPGSEESNQCSEEVSHFSASRDRGGYKHVNEDTFSFFVTMFQLLMSSEDEYGSFPPNVIDNIVLNSEIILCLWDELVGNDLTQDESLDLLIQVSQTSVRVVMKGIIKRRINEHLKKVYNSVALRARLAAS